MLILTRRISESLIVGDKEIIITVLGVKGNQVRIGVQANSQVVIDREEIYLRKQHEREQTTSAITRPILKKLAGTFLKR